MLPHRPLMVHTAQELLNLYPRSPLLTSLETQWQNITMAHMRLPAFEHAESCTPWHRITIYTTSNIAERSIDGRLKNDSPNAGDITVVPANIGISARWMGEGEMLGIGLDTSLFAYAIDDAINLHPAELVPHFATPDPLIYQLGLSLKTALEQNLVGSRLYAETTAAMLSVHLLQWYSEQKLEFKDYTSGLSRSTLRQVIEYIHANLDRELGLAELAAIAHLSPHYFTRLFKKSTGATPHQFVIQCRVERAKVLLLNGKDSIAKIAQQVGFANQAHLHVHIKRSLGVTPKMILQQRKNR